MNFNSVIFLIYLPLVILIYWILPHKARWVFLLLASYFFYAYHNVWLIFLILGTTLVSFFAALGIDRSENKKVRVFLLVLSLILILGALFVFKYLDFAITSVVSFINLFGGEATYSVLNLILPVGISFYTFQTLSYVIDVYKGKFAAETHFGYYALFVSFFPQLVAGPIERPDNLLPQLKAVKKIDSDCFSYGFQYLISGFVKKIVIADFLGVFVASTYGNIAQSSGASLMIATIFFAIQIYGDFAGYSDIALGASHLLGIHLTKNFDHPYLSKSVREFYRRWHITLNSWLTDYIYIPMGGSRCGLPRHLLNIMVVFLVSGFWHGASWNYVIWGLLNGLLICIEILLRKPLENMTNKTERRKKVVNFISVPITFMIICSTWVFFRASDISSAFLVYQRIFTSFAIGNGLENFKEVTFVLRVILTLSLFIFIPYLPKMNLKPDEEGNYDAKQIFSTLVIYVPLVMMILMCWLDQLSSSGESGFIYFQF